MNKLLISVTLTILALHLTATYLFWYQSYTWFDIPMHMLGGAWVALLGAYVFDEKFRIFDLKKNPWLTLVMVLAWALLIGAIWEGFEFAAGTVPAAISQHFVRHVPYLEDSLWDLLNDALGSIPAALYIYFRKR